jgi:hypothetical protein
MRRAGATAVGEQPALFWDWGTARVKRRSSSQFVDELRAFICKKHSATGFVHSIHIRRLSSRDCTVCTGKAIAPDIFPSN